MRRLLSLLLRWPLLQQILHGKSGCGREAMSEKTRNLRARIAEEGVKVARSICPYCAVGCGQLIYHRDDRILSIEGDPESPISQGNLCPKGAASRQLLSHEHRVTRVKYRAPFAKAWETLSLERAMEMIVERMWESRRRTFRREKDGLVVNQTLGIAHLGGATLDNEENYLIKKLFAGGLGMVCVSNQARI